MTGRVGINRIDPIILQGRHTLEGRVIQDLLEPEGERGDYDFGVPFHNDLRAELTVGAIGGVKGDVIDFKQYVDLSHQGVGSTCEEIGAIVEQRDLLGHLCYQSLQLHDFLFECLG